jgi:DNA-binding protein Fis
VLRQVNGNKSEAAKILGITRQTLRKKLTDATV